MNDLPEIPDVLPLTADQDAEETRRYCEMINAVGTVQVDGPTFGELFANL